MYGNFSLALFYDTLLPDVYIFFFGRNVGNACYAYLMKIDCFFYISVLN